MPKSLVGSAFDPGRRGWKALAAAGALALLAAAFFAWQSAPVPEPVPVTSAVTSAPVEGYLVVAVSGKVHQPGLVKLAPGARVADALAAAGGPLPEADLSTLNLARKVTDGELIVVGQPSSDVGQVGKVNLNTATLAQLDSLPGVGPVLAQRIIDYRAKNGGFRDVADLRRVDGIGEETYAKLKDLVVVG